MDVRLDSQGGRLGKRNSLYFYSRSLKLLQGGKIAKERGLQEVQDSPCKEERDPLYSSGNEMLFSVSPSHSQGSAS